MLAGGIAQALLTTAAGMLVAIPALTAYLYFVGRVDSLITEIDALGQQARRAHRRRRRRTDEASESCVAATVQCSKFKVQGWKSAKFVTLNFELGTLNSESAMPLKTHQDDLPAINLTPMIDIVFNLIIFFMVSTRFTEIERKSICRSARSAATASSASRSVAARSTSIVTARSVRWPAHDARAASSQLATAHRQIEALGSHHSR